MNFNQIVLKVLSSTETFFYFILIVEKHRNDITIDISITI